MTSVLSSGRSAARRPGLRYSVFYAAFFLQVGVSLPFWPVLLSSRGLTASEIGIVLAATPAARMFIGPLIGFAADRYRLSWNVLALLGFLSALGMTAVGFVWGFWPVLLLALLAVPLYPSLLPIVDSRALHAQMTDGLDFGRVRLWGSASFVLANLIAGALLLGRGPETILVLVVGGVVLGTLALPILPPRPKTATHDGPHVDWRAAFGLLRRPPFLAVLVVAGGIQASHALLYGFGTLAWRAQGLDARAIGGLWAMGVVAEVVLLSQSKPLLRRFGAKGLIILGGIAAVLRWVLLSREPAVAVLLPLQLLHGLSFAATYVGAIHLVQESVPAELAATAQATYASVSGGVIYSLVTAAAGPLFALFGAQAYLGVAGFAALCTLGGLVIFRRLKMTGFSPTASSVEGT